MSWTIEYTVVVRDGEHWWQRKGERIKGIDFDGFVNWASNHDPGTRLIQTLEIIEPNRKRGRSADDER